MKKRKRFILFSLLAFFFILSALGTVFYSQGFRFDFEKKRVTQTGGFFFKVWPKNVQVYLNGKPKGKTDFFFRAVLIDNLLPKKYQIEIKKEGYQPWKKNLEIKEGQVTEAKNIVLVPEKIKFSILAKKVKDFFPSPDGKKIILNENENEKGFSLKLLDLEKNLKSHLINEADISKRPVEFSFLEFSPDSKGFLFKTESGKEIKYFFFDLEARNLFPLDFLGKDIEELSFNLKGPGKIFFLFKKKAEENFLFEADLNKKEVSKILLPNISTYKVSGGNLFWLTKDGLFLKSDLAGKRIEKISQAFPIKEELKYQIYLKEPKIFLREGETLYIFDEDTKTFQKIIEGMGSLNFSPDSRKMAYLSNHEIWILFLKKIEDQPQREEGEKLFLVRFSQEIENLFWFTDHYLIFNVGKVIKIAEIDDRDIINIYDLAEFENPKIFWNQRNKKLYTLSQENLFVSPSLVK